MACIVPLCWSRLIRQIPSQWPSSVRMRLTGLNNTFCCEPWSRGALLCWQRLVVRLAQNCEYIYMAHLRLVALLRAFPTMCLEIRQPFQKYQGSASNPAVTKLYGMYFLLCELPVRGLWDCRLGYSDAHKLKVFFNDLLWYNTRAGAILRECVILCSGPDDREP